MLGQQRYGTVTWSGDVSADWVTLRRQIADGLNFCAAGQPYWTTDIGGFFVRQKLELWFWHGDFDDGVADLGYRELYVRWFQFGAFLPMFRSHGTDTPRQLWRFGEPGELTYESLKKFLHLRYRLLPYIYSLAGWTTQKAYTMLRALPFDFRDDAQTYECGDQYMSGPAFLVSPVTTSMYYNSGSVAVENVERTRAVYLPAGTGWFDFWTDEFFEGGQTLDARATLDMMPLFVRSGSIVPMGPERQHVNDRPDATVELHVYPGANGKFLIYEDEGDNYNYESGSFSTIPIMWEDKKSQLVLGQRSGDYPGMLKQRKFKIFLHGTDSSSVEGGKRTTNRQIVYDGQPLAVDFDERRVRVSIIPSKRGSAVAK
jgi:alpha-D-xyloside xylohydrolase